MHIFMLNSYIRQSRYPFIKHLPFFATFHLRNRSPHSKYLALIDPSPTSATSLRQHRQTKKKKQNHRPANHSVAILLLYPYYTRYSAIA